MNKFPLTVAVVALVISLSSIAFPQKTQEIVGSGSGQEHFFFELFHAGMADGGDVVATSTVDNSTLLARDLMRAKQIDMTLTTNDGTLTLPASTTLNGFLAVPGDSRTILVRNATTTASIDLTIAAGTGMTLKNSASSTASLIGDTDGKNTMFVTLVRQADKSFNVFLSRFHD